METSGKKRKHSGLNTDKKIKKKRTSLDKYTPTVENKHHQNSKESNNKDKLKDTKPEKTIVVKDRETKIKDLSLCNKQIDTSKTSVSATSKSTHSKPKSKEKHKEPTQKEDKIKEAKNRKKKKPVYGPVKPEEFSSNWEQLKMILEKDKTSKRIPAKKRQRNVNTDKNKPSTTDSQTTDTEPAPDIWFDDVDDIFLETNHKKLTGTKDGKKDNTLVKLGSFTGLTKAVAMDCEMVGVGQDKRQDMLARVSIVNQYGHCVYDHFVQPQEKVTDYRTYVSGVRRSDMETGKQFSEVCKEVSDIIKGRILVGHAIQNDLKVLFLSHPRKEIRDTSRYKPFRQLFDGRTPSLKKLSAKVLGVSVQEGEHSSVQDAQATMRLYTMHKRVWEKELNKKRPFKSKKNLKKGKKKPKVTMDLDDLD